MLENKAVFLDRDGVINVERGYVHLPETFQFQQGIFDLCKAAEALDYLLVVVTNQAGVGRGYYSEADFLELTNWMVAHFAEQGIHITRVYYCPDHPIYGLGRYKRESPDRKPNPGMLVRAAAELNIDLTRSVLIGDKLSDMLAAEAAGIPMRVLFQAESEAGEIHGVKCIIAHSLDEIRRALFANPPGVRSQSYAFERAID
jgi:D-glycero-D-manno-heptose 1,7-bisphosphate phosphatase